MARLWARLDRLASLTSHGLPVTPIDPDALSAVERPLLGEWAADWSARVEAARKKAAKS